MQFFQAAAVSTQLNACITKAMTERIEKNLDRNFTRIL